MDVCRKETIAEFNEQVEAICKEAKKTDAWDSTFVSLVLFNDEIEVVKFAESLSNLKKMRRRDYVPESTTAMLDAVGETLLLFARSAADSPETSYLIVIISDGLENASRSFTYGRLAEMIQKRQMTERWTFTYMGANQDLSDLSKRLAIPEGNMARYTSTGEGTARSMMGLSDSVIKHMDAVSLGRTSSSSFFGKEGEVADLSDDDDDDDSNSGGSLLH